MIAQIDTHYIKIKPFKVFSRMVGYIFFEGRPVTTKGRWINSLIIALFQIEKKLPQLRKVREPIFIVGTGRSGTTILGKILSIHRNIGFINEPKALWHAIYPNEDVIGSYSRGTAFFRLNAEHADASVISAAHRLYGAYLFTTCSKRVVDKYPELIFRIKFVKKIFPNAKFIFITRNGWNTCYSVKKWSEKFTVYNDGEIYDWWGVNNRKWNLLNEQIVSQDDIFRDIAKIVKTFKEDVNKAAVEWIVTMREGIRQMSENPDSILMVKYEDITNSPYEMLKKILKFCELPNDKKIFQYAKRVITHVKDYPQPNIHSAILPILEQTNRMLGY